MRLRNFINGMIAILLAAVYCFSWTTAHAASSDAPTFVREVTLSKGNWLWHHYKRMSVPYRNAHTFTVFMETEACFLADRKCTEHDWRHVPRSQKIYAPTENVLLKLGANDPIPVLGLSLAAKDSGLYSLHARTLPFAQVEETALNDRIKNLEFVNRGLRSQYSALAVVYQYLVIVTSLFVCAFLILTLIMWRTYTRKNEEIAELKDDLEVERSLSVAPELTEVVVPSRPVIELPRISALGVMNMNPFPNSMALIFKQFDLETGIGYAEDEVHKRIYQINRNTKGNCGQLKRDERFSAITMNQNFVLQILEK